MADISNLPTNSYNYYPAKIPGDVCGKTNVDYVTCHSPLKCCQNKDYGYYN